MWTFGRECQSKFNMSPGAACFPGFPLSSLCVSAINERRSRGKRLMFNVYAGLIFVFTLTLGCPPRAFPPPLSSDQYDAHTPTDVGV